MITAKKDPQINIKISKPTIYSADDHSKIIINSNQGGPKNVRIDFFTNKFTIVYSHIHMLYRKNENHKVYLSINYYVYKH